MDKNKTSNEANNRKGSRLTNERGTMAIKYYFIKPTDSGYGVFSNTGTLICTYENSIDAIWDATDRNKKILNGRIGK